MTATYMQILIHTMNGSLFPNVDPNSVSWTGPPPEIVTVQSLLYASLAISLFAAFLAMLGKQWVTRYLRNRGGSAAEKSRDRQRKLDGLEAWYFYLVVESLPVMLQLALLLLACALSLYLWTINRTVAGVILAFTTFGIVSYGLFTLAATLYYNCPYQTPPSIVTRAVVSYLTHSNAAFARALQPLITSFPTIKDLGRPLRRLRFQVLRVLGRLRHGPTVGEAAEDIPLAAVTQPPPTRIFGEGSIDWEVFKGDVRCISWVLDSITDPDVILSTVRFVADMIWYPEIAQAVSPHILADLFFDCLLDRRVIPNKSEHAILIGMALASVLSIQLCTDPQDEALGNLCKRIEDRVHTAQSPEPTTPVVLSLHFVAQSLSPTKGPWMLSLIRPRHLPIMDKLWLSKVLLQTLWRWRCIWDPNSTISLRWVGPICRELVADGDKSPTILKTNCFLIMAISLGSQLDIRDLYPPNDRYVLPKFSYQVNSLISRHALQRAIDLFSRRLRVSIGEGSSQGHGLAEALSALTHLDPVGFTRDPGLGFAWLHEILNSSYRERARYEMASLVLRLFGEYHNPTHSAFSLGEEPARVQSLLDFLLLNKKYCSTAPPADPPSNPGSIALRILSESRVFTGFYPAAIPLLTSMLSPTHPLQLRGLALKTLRSFMVGWFSSEMENEKNMDLEKLLQGVGDPFQCEGLPLDGYSPIVVVEILIEGASSDLWRDHLCRSNFTSYEVMTSTEDGRRTALAHMLDTAINSRTMFLSTPAKITAGIRRLEELQCLNTAQVVIMWAWTVGVVNPMDRDAWKSVENNTLRFYQTHGMGRMNALKRHITDTTLEVAHTWLFGLHHGDTLGLRRMGIVRQPASTVHPGAWPPAPQLASDVCTDLRVSKVCYLKMLYHLSGCNPTTWKEVVEVEEVDDKIDVVPATSFPFADWACDYP